jgi:hypothetical protein
MTEMTSEFILITNSKLLAYFLSTKTCYKMCCHMLIGHKGMAGAFQIYMVLPVTPTASGTKVMLPAAEGGRFILFPA